MNWSRGLLRAWMVFTALWLTFVGITTYSGWPQKQVGEQDPVADLDRIKGNVAKMAQEDAPEGDIDAYIASEGADVETMQPFAKYAPNSKHDNPFAKYVKPKPKTNAEIDAEYREAVWHRLKADSGLGAFVPGGLFLLGWALLWIGRGFRKT